MRLSNRKKTSVYNFINTVLIMLLAAGTGAYFLEENKFNVLGKESLLLIAVPLLLIVLFYLSGRQIFEYDSEGEALHFRNRNVIPFLQKPLNDEFPKYKLLKFEIINMFFVKRLYISISSKNNGTTLLKYEISYLTRKELADLRFSLNKVTKTNKENRANI
ncbi:MULTISPECIES: hypothetical protein [Chryseobacterium]|uniref:PH domain-containing protein n=1 Tax=Chryseobacterium nepalense TaxID=1854498 RepID=A0ABY4K7G8_9FLAO|nr:MULTISPECIES: hypothetical protein [Chryseobacterium]MEA1850656.1 hypothetical protein [Chryseobacterium sp. MHB01]MEC5174281.1 hypothetical protein [Chryseobacterium nepalense]UPQ76731.1 hypothetical protein M0D58_04065 [Chryseobacterium nepalense]